MFAEDVGLLPERCFSRLLKACATTRRTSPHLLRALGGHEPGRLLAAAARTVPCFNGGLFADAAALPLTRDQIDLLIEAARPTGRTSSPPSSAPCWSARSTRSNATSSARTTPRAPTSNAW